MTPGDIGTGGDPGTRVLHFPSADPFRLDFTLVPGSQHLTSDVGRISVAYIFRSRFKLEHASIRSVVVIWVSCGLDFLEAVF